MKENGLSSSSNFSVISHICAPTYNSMAENALFPH
jgi:hypothetical protein